MDYRRFLYHIANDVTAKDLKDLKFLCCGSEIARAICENINDAMEFIDCLEQRAIVSESNTERLEELSKDVHRIDVADKIRKYRESGVSETRKDATPTIAGRKMDRLLGFLYLQSLLLQLRRAKILVVCKQVITLLINSEQLINLPKHTQLHVMTLCVTV